jgi:hypothetical protein
MITNKDIAEVGTAYSPSRSDSESHAAHEAPVTDAKQASFEQRKIVIWWRRIVGLIWDTEAQGDPEYRRYVKRLDRIFL